MVENPTLERRSFIRVKDSLPTQVQFINGETQKAEAIIENIGEGGVCIVADLDKNKVKKELYLKIDLPGCPFSLDIAGVVTWIKEKEKGAVGLGLKFSGISTSTRSHINKYIQSRIETSPLSQVKKFAFSRKTLNKLNEKERRNLIILNAIRRREPISKAQVSQIADLNMGTITNYIDEYIKKGLVLEMGLDVSTGGRRPTLLELNPRYGFCIGIDISNKNKGLVLLVCDIKGKIINKYIAATHSEEDFKRNSIISRVSKLIQSSFFSKENILGVGVTVEGSSEEDSTDLTQALEQEFDAPVLIENACCAKLFAERIMGPSFDESENVLYFSIHTSDCGLIINGDICRINSQFTIDSQTKKSPSENDCWENINECLLKPLPVYNKQNLETLARNLSLRLSILTNILCLDMIILGDIDDKETIRDLLPEIRDKAKNKTPKIILEHFGRESAALGVVLLITREVFIHT